jgi:hypothetical protein
VEIEMKINVPEEIRRNPALNSVVDRAIHILADEVGPSASLVQADWSMAKDERSQTVVELKLSDYTGSAQSRFVPEEMANLSLLRIRLHRLWEDLLQVRSGKQVERLKQLVQELDGD